MYSDDRLKRVMAICLGIALCLQRLSMAAGSAFLGVSIAVFLVLLFRAYKKGDLIERVRPYSCYYKIFGIMMLCMLPSLFFSGDIKDSIKLFCEMFLYRMMPFYIVTLFMENQGIKKIFVFLIMSLSIDSMVALGQLLLGVSNRGWGFGGNSLHLASILSVVIPIVLVIICDASFDSKLKKMCLIALPCMILGVLAGKSRGAWLTLSIVMPIVVILYACKSKRILVSFLLAFLCLGIFFSESKDYTSRLISISDLSTNTSNLARISIWKASNNMILDHPIVGVGLGQYGDYYQKKYFLDKRFRKYNHPHNNILKIWSETGTLGVIGFLTMNLFILIANFKAWLKDRNPYSLIIWSGWLSFTIFGMFDVIIDHGAITKIWWFILAAMLVLKEKEKSEKNS